MEESQTLTMIRSKTASLAVKASRLPHGCEIAMQGSLSTSMASRRCSGRKPLSTCHGTLPAEASSPQISVIVGGCTTTVRTAATTQSMSSTEIARDAMTVGTKRTRATNRLSSGSDASASTVEEGLAAISWYRLSPKSCKKRAPSVCVSTAVGLITGAGTEFVF